MVKEYVNSLASDDHTGMDSFHECLQEYGEGIEVVQICLEPEDASLKDEEISAIGDLSFDECNKETLDDFKEKNDREKVNGVCEVKFSKSEESLDDPDDDMTITEDDVLVTPRELPDTRSKSADRNNFDEQQCLWKQNSKDISTSDEMVFAVTPTGLERISFDKYWKEGEDTTQSIKTPLEKVKSDESWKECLNSPTEDISFKDATSKISVPEENNLLYIDHEIDGYETCPDEDSSSVVCTEKDRKLNGDHKIKAVSKHNKIAFRNKDNDLSAKNINVQNFSDVVDDDTSLRPYLQEHVIKQMKSLRIEPLNINISNKRIKKRSPSKSDRKPCVEYYNDQAECLKEIKKKKFEEELQQNKVVEKKTQLQKQNLSEESTDLENYVPGCHKCFLENYAYAITKAYIAQASACKYCEVIRDMLEAPKISGRRMSAPALVNLESSETEDEDLLTVPSSRGRRTSAGPLKFIVPSRRPSFSPQAMTVTATDKREAQRWGPLRRVTLKRSPGSPLGVSIVGGKVDIVSNESSVDGEEKAIFGIFIKNVVPESPAGRCGDLHTGDRILEVDGVCVRSAQHERAVQLIKAAGDTVTLTVQSLMVWNTDSSDMEVSTPPASPARLKKTKLPAPPKIAVVNGTPEHEIKITVTQEPELDKDNETEKDTDKSDKEKKQVYSDSDSDDDDDEEDQRELQGRTYSEKGVEIDRASAGAIKRSKEEKEADPEEEDDFGYTTNKIRKKYASLGDSVVSVRLERTPKAGLGLSLAGHRDRSRMAVFVCGLHPAGAAAKASPAVKVGDEILEVNGIVLHGRCHLNASAIIKGLVGPIFKIILLRRKSALEDVAVKPLTQFPVALEEESEDRFAGYKGVRDITIKKGPSGLGIMIIEGRHTEAGRGIFVSDLQEGSAAEQAGLNIGDMILAVNRDSLLTCSYDIAAAKLKHTEGVVILTVCSPNMKDPDKPDDPVSGSSVSRNQTPDPGALGAASRPQTPRPAPSPVKAEPPADPAVAPIASNQDTVVEIDTGSQVLGVVLIGGSDTKINGPATVILDIYKGGAIDKDGRLKVGDQIRECCGIPITEKMVNERIRMTIKQKRPKMKLTVYRPDPVPFEELEVELNRKSARPLGLHCVAPVAGQGVYVEQLLPGSPAEQDGRLERGDFLVAIDGKDVTTSDFLTVAVMLKLVGNKTVIKAKRFKIVGR